jgi:hypothetical protein
MILTSSNAQLAQDPPFKLNPNGSTIPLPADSFIPILLSTKSTNDHRPLCCRPKIAKNNNAAQLPSGAFVIEESICAQMHADYIHFHERDLAFAQDMGRLYIIAPQNLNKVHTDPEHTVPHSLITRIYALMHKTIINHLLNTTCLDMSSVVHSMNDFYHRLSSAYACTDVILLRALDACAILGGVTLPCWPPNKQWKGALINPKHLPRPGIEQTEDDEQLLATIRRLERWGVPLWSFSISSTNFRLDVTPDGLPSEDKSEELVFQGKLRSVDWRSVQSTRLLKMVGRVHTEDVFKPEYTGLPAGSERLRLQRAIVALLDHDSPSHTNFASFSAIAQDILGSIIWTGNRHEATLHPATFDISQPMPWNRVRDAIRECAHSGVNIALFQIPLPWIKPDCATATMLGEYSMMEQLSTISLIITTARGTWFTLEVDDFAITDKSVVHQFAKRFVPDGLCAWSFVQSGLQRKDGMGKTIPRSRFTVRLLFKERHVLEMAEKSMNANFPNHEQRSRVDANVRDDILFNYSFFVHPHFVDVAYGEPISHASRTQIMALAPSFDVIPASVGNTDRAMQVKRVVHSLRHHELFEVAKFPPFIAPPLPPSSCLSTPSSTPSSVGLDMSSCMPDVLRQLASSAHPNHDLSFMDVCRMQRLACIIEVLAKDGHFMCRVFRSNGPYLRILRYLSTMIRDTSPAGSSFSPQSNRVDVGPYHEAVRLTPIGRVEIILNLDTSDSDIRLPTEAELAKWSQNMEKMWDYFSQKRSRSEQRRSKEQRRIAKAIAASAAWPSSSS